MCIHQNRLDKAILTSTQNIQCHDKKTVSPKYFFSGVFGRISLGLKNESESAMLNEPSVFELLRLDYITYTSSLKSSRRLPLKVKQKAKAASI